MDTDTKIDSLNNLLKNSTGTKKIDILNELVTTYDTISYIKSLDYANLSLELTKKFKNKEDVSNALDRVGRIHFYLSNYDKSINYFIKALKIRKKTGNKKAIAKSYNNLGVTYLNLDKNNKALEYLQKAWDISEEIGYTELMNKLSNNLGIVYMKLANYEKSLEYYQKALNNSVKTDDKKLQVACLNNIGMVYWYLEDYKKALEYYLNAIKMSKKLKYKWNISNCSRNIGEVYIKLHDYDNASLYLKNGLEIAEKIGSNHLIKDCYVTFSELYYAKGNYKKAYDYHKLYSEIKDSIFTEEIGKNIAKMEVKFQTVKKENEIKILKKENEINILKLNKNRIQRNFLIISSLLILLLVIVLYNRFLLKKKTNKQLQNAIKKISESEADLKELNATKNKLFTIISHDLKGPFSSLLGFSEILAQESDKYNKEKIIQFSNIINTSAHDLFNLVENLLQWSRCQSKNMKYYPEKINLKELVTDIFSVLQFNAKNKNITLNSKIHENTYVFADSNIVSIVIRNLVSNALKFTDNGGKIVVKTRQCLVSTTSIEKNNSIEISVIDTGIGISEENIDKLFKINTNYTTQGTSDEKGTGLGLIICKEFIEKSGGKIWVESKPGIGSTFKFTLPKIS